MKKGEYAWSVLLALIVGLVPTATAQEVPHLNVTQRGGFPGRPVMNGIAKTTNGVNVSWDGPAGYYQLYIAHELGNPDWQPSGTPNLNRTATLTNISGNAFFKVSGPAAQYAGSQACAECHEGVHGFDQTSRHAQAFQTLKAIGRDSNPTCLRCHTVGFGLPTGFTSELATPHLAGVQCESCHGPAAAHAANEMDLTKRPRKEIASQVCGGCHNGFHSNNTFDEWKSSGHFTVVEDMNPSGRINSCGRCHSGSARLALIKGANPALTVTNDANVGITCVICHDPHQTYEWTNVLTSAVATNQLRYPLASTNYFSLTTSATFSNRTDINICAQCHNDRGAAWNSAGRPPHHSPQYNVMLGTVGLLLADGPSTNFINSATNARPGAHALRLEKQCVTCHMPTRAVAAGAHQDMPGHSFKVEADKPEAYDSCKECHTFPELLQDFTALVIESRMQQLKSKLDEWATSTNSPVALRDKYQELAWEYTTPGDLSTGTAGPTSSEQGQIPLRIKYARFNLYIVNHDGSLGTHNPLHTLALLDAARAWVQEELNP